MLQWLKSRSASKDKARDLYGTCVAAARDPVFYRDWGVANSYQGRFEMVTLHVALLLRNLSMGGAAGKAQGQGLVEAMVDALDDDMRELGVGDLTVPKKVSAATSAFYGRLKSYDEALKVGDAAALAAALERNVPSADGARLASTMLAAHILAAAERLAKPGANGFSPPSGR